MHYSNPVQDARNYINENLTAGLSLEALADYVNFSPYHFQRLLLLCTGEAPNGICTTAAYQSSFTGLSLNKVKHYRNCCKIQI